MAVSMFMKIDDVKGESTKAEHEDQIELLSLNWGMTQTGSAHTGTGGGTSSVDVQDLTFTKYIDSSSPTLIKLCCQGTHFKLATLYLRKAGDKQFDYLRVEMYDGLISKIGVAGTGAGDDRFAESISLNFAAFKYYYTPQVKGAAGAEIPATWNIAKNTEAV